MLLITHFIRAAMPILYYNSAQYETQKQVFDDGHLFWDISALRRWPSVIIFDGEKKPVEAYLLTYTCIIS